MAESITWTDERVDQLRAMWSEGMSASQIAKQLGGVTRNAVIGKVHRLGLSNRTPGGKLPEEPKPAEKPAAAAAAGAKPAGRGRDDAPEPEEPAPPPEPEAAPLARAMPQIRDASEPRPPGLPTPEEEAARATLAEIEKMARKVSLMDLTERTCKWPIGDPNDDNFHFCGLPSVPGKPYCEYHVAVAFQPMSNRRDRIRIGR